MKFLNELEIKIIDDKNTKPVFETLNNFNVKIYQGHVITIPKGFKTDFASVPRLLWWLYPPIGQGYWRIALVHDYLYKVVGFAKVINGKILYGLSRSLCDEYFYQGIIYECKNYTKLSKPRIYFRANIMKKAVRIYGFISWNRCKKELINIHI